MFLRLALLLLDCVLCAEVPGQVIVVPGTYASTEANSSDNAPLGIANQRFQEVISASLLSALHVGDQIVALAFRVQGGETALPAQTIPNYEIRLSQSLNAPGSLSATFADNRGLDEVIARSGSLTINPGDFPGGSSPNSFGWISFTTPYTYRGGNLLIEAAGQSFPGGGRDADAVYPYTAGLAQTAFGTGFGATMADLGFYNESIVLGLQVVPVPEPVWGSVLIVSFLLGLAIMHSTISVFRSAIKPLQEAGAAGMPGLLGESSQPGCEDLPA
jgi:hypothetical protein